MSVNNSNVEKLITSALALETKLDAQIIELQNLKSLYHNTLVDLMLAMKENEGTPAPPPVKAPEPVAASVATKTDTMSLEERVVDLLKAKGPMLFPHIQKELGISGKDGMKELYEMLKASKKVAFDKGVYKVVG